ncbi:MAG TPA: TOBE domain-containing protein [Bacillota bacterium]|nr:TOBE domain-containing protein [Bacillota bacterium]
MLSARNQLKARVKEIRSDNITSEVILDVSGQEMCSTITVESARRLGLKVGDDVTAVVKASSVMLAK